MLKVNLDIRQYMSDNNVLQKDLAQKLGITAQAVSSRLKTELTRTEKEKYLNLIDAIVAERQDEPVNEVSVDEHIATDEQDITEDVSLSTKFQIGDRVKIPSKQDKIGTVVDIWSSLAKQSIMYAVESEENGNFGMYAEDQLEPAPLPIAYTFEAHIDGNVAVVTMNASQADETWVYARGHAHIIHDGAVGLAQAVSYAARRMFEVLDKKQESKIYFK